MVGRDRLLGGLDGSSSWDDLLAGVGPLVYGYYFVERFAIAFDSNDAVDKGGGREGGQNVCEKARDVGAGGPADLR